MINEGFANEHVTQSDYVDYPQCRLFFLGFIFVDIVRQPRMGYRLCTVYRVFIADEATLLSFLPIFLFGNFSNLYLYYSKLAIPIYIYIYIMLNNCSKFG